MSKPTKVSTTPAGHQSVSPYMIIAGAAEAIAFYVKALGATELHRMAMPDGRIGHAEIRIGDSVVMIADEFPEMGAKGPQALGGSPVTLHVYVPDVDAAVARAVAAGGTLSREVKDQFYGDRIGGVTDPFGYTWYLATHIEDVSPAEMASRMASQKPQ